MIRLLTFTDLYPNPAQPRHGIFVEHRLRQLVGTGEVTARVIAPVPSVPSLLPASRGRRPPAEVPARTTRHGLQVLYPRFPVIPRLSNWANPVSMALASLASVRQLQRESGDLDIIDAHFFYPAGIAAILLGRWLGKPVVITARGSDINVHSRFRVQRAWILWAARRAAALVTVSAALRDALANLGVLPARITVVRNGVDLETFLLQDRTALRQELGWFGPMLLSVGNLVEDKGHRLVIEALRELPDVKLTIVGSGPDERHLREIARKIGVEQRVDWIPYLQQSELARYYAAADATVLASSREGMANVLLESLACGTRVVASAAGGNPEVVCAPEAGVLLRERSAAEVAQGYRRLAASPVKPEATRCFAERFGWAEPIDTLRELLRGVASRAAAKATAASQPGR